MRWTLRAAFCLFLMCCAACGDGAVSGNASSTRVASDDADTPEGEETPDAPGDVSEDSGEDGAAEPEDVSEDSVEDDAAEPEDVSEDSGEDDAQAPDVDLCEGCDDGDPCNGVETCDPELGCLPGEAPNCDVAIQDIYFAQNHVLRPSDPYFGLVSMRKALIKATVTASAGGTAPPMRVVLRRDGEELALPLTGPATLPMAVDSSPGVVQHIMSDSYTAMIPAQWVQPGLEVSVEAGHATETLTALTIGAPNRVHMTLFNVHYWGYSPNHRSDYSQGWEAELKAKWPVSELTFERVEKISFDTFVAIPRPDVNAPAVLASSPQEYQTKTGTRYDGEQGIALMWNDALQKAGGQDRLSLFYTNIINSQSATLGGQAGGFAGVGSIIDGVFIHELGHALSLPHWGNVPAYPYQGEIFGVGIDGDDPTTPHVGPTWGFDDREEGTLPPYAFPYFIPPTVQDSTVEQGAGNVGLWKRDPMQGGGSGDQEQGFVFRMFSDYSVNQMRTWLHGFMVVWNEEEGRYATWNEDAQAYTTLQAEDDLVFPVEADLDVYSLLVNISGATEEANYVYPVIGPYKSGVIRRFDPLVEADRAEATARYCPSQGCDLTLRVVQGGQTRHIMLNAPWLPEADPVTTAGFFVRAVNLPVRDGRIGQAQLLLTPNVNVDGMPEAPQVLYSMTNLDCNGDEAGEASIDECGQCTGGETGRAPNEGCCSPGGRVSLETWTDMPGEIADIPLMEAPDVVEPLTSWDKRWSGQDNVGSRVRALLCVPETGAYRLAIASDDNGQLWLSDGEDPAQKRLIAWVGNWTPYQDFEDEANQISEVMMLEGGRNYYIETLHQNGVGGSHVTVAWSRGEGELEVLGAQHTLPAPE